MDYLFFTALGFAVAWNADLILEWFRPPSPVDLQRRKIEAFFNKPYEDLEYDNYHQD